MAKRGRKPVLTPAAKDEILAIIRDGGSRNTAAAFIGCHTTTIANEAARDPPFLDALKKAEAECEMHHVRRIKEGKSAWQSSAWFLERKWPRKYAKREAPDLIRALESIRVRSVVRSVKGKPKPR